MGLLNLRKILSTWLSFALLVHGCGAHAASNFQDVTAKKLNVDNVQIDGNTVSTTNTNGDLTFDLNGTGSIILTDLTASRVPYLNASKKITASSVTDTELALLSGLSTTILTQTNTVTGITNKTFTSPTLTTPSLDIGTFDGQASTPSNPSSGFYKLYFKDDGKAYKLDSAGTEGELGGGGGGSSGINILSTKNYNAEAGVVTPWSETGGGTLAVTSTAANVGNGTYAFSFDASANTDYASVSATTIPAGLFGQNCLLQFYAKGFDSNITFQVHDGTNIVSSYALTGALSGYTPIQMNFVCPSSGTLEMRVYASGNAAIGYWDEVHLGQAINLTNVSQAKFVGSGYFATTANCIFEVTSSSLAALSDNDCPGPTVDENPGPGVLQTTDANAPSITLNNADSACYEISFQGTSKLSSAQAASMAIYDGTSTFGQGATTDATSTSGQFNLTGIRCYNTPGNRTWQIYAASASGAFNIYSDNGTRRLYFTIKSYPNRSQIAVNSLQGDYGWTAYTPSFGGFGTVTNIDVKHRRVGDDLEVDGAFTVGTTAASAATMSLPTGLTGVTSSSTYRLAGRWHRDSSANNTYKAGPINIQSAATDVVFSVDDYTSGISPVNSLNGSTIIGNNQNVRVNFRVAINGWQTSNRAPALVGSVINQSSGVATTCSGYIINSGGNWVVSREEGDCISSVTDVNTGRSTVNFTTPFASAPWVCNCTVIHNSAGFCRNDVNSTLSASAWSFVLTSDGGTNYDGDYMFECKGPK